MFVGKASNPVAVIKRGEIRDYITGELVEMYAIWKRYHTGMGLPYSANWGDYPERFIDILELMINTFEGAR